MQNLIELELPVIQLVVYMTVVCLVNVYIKILRKRKQI